MDRLRQETILAALRDTGATAYVGGRTARYGDEADKIASRIPVFAGAVVLLGVEQQPVVPYAPLFMFAILFGLSTGSWPRRRSRCSATGCGRAGARAA